MLYLALYRFYQLLQAVAKHMGIISSISQSPKLRNPITSTGDSAFIMSISVAIPQKMIWQLD